MKLTVNKYLNARIGNASTDASCKFYRTPGDTMEIDGVLVGTEIDGNSIWFHCKDDECYYWSGGIEEVEFEMNLNINTLDEKDKNVLLIDATKYFWNYWKTKIHNLTGVYVGSKITNGQVVNANCLVFQVSQKTPDIPYNKISVPPRVVFKGFSIETDVQEASLASFDKIAPGDSISRIQEMNESGTVCLKVYRIEQREKVYYLLTNYHVAGFDLLRKKQFFYRYPPDISNRQIMVPRHVDNKSSEFIGAFKEGYLSSYYDVALVLLNDEDDATNLVDDFVITGYIDVNENPDFYKGQEVTLYGSRSGKQSNSIVSLKSNQFFSYTGGNRLELMELIQVNKYSQPGDSGSPVVFNQRIIGIHVGADDKFSYLIPIKRILSFFNLKISKS